MFDAVLRSRIDPALKAAAQRLAKTGVGANAVTAIGCLIGIAAAFAIAHGQFFIGLALIFANRIADGLDGSLARLNGTSEFGGYLDSLADYVFYVAVPIGFAAASPVNVWPALILVSSFTLTAVSFLALAAILARRGVNDQGHGEKAFIYSTGLMEGGETIAFFIVMCLLPGYFGILAFIFAGLCIATMCQRLWLAHRLLL